MLVRSSAPLRLGLAGGGTDVPPYCDHYGGMVVNATISMYAHSNLIDRNDDEIHFEATDIQEKEILSINDEIIINGRLDLHKAVYNRIIKEFSLNPFPHSLVTYADVPPGSGLGTSSTIVVAMIRAYVERFELTLGDHEIANLAWKIERQDVGLSGGSQDAYAASFGGINYLEFYANNKVVVNPLSVRREVIDEIEASLLLYFTGVSRESAHIIDRQVKNVERVIKSNDQGNSNQSVAAMHQVGQQAICMKDALITGNISEIPEILKRSWESKKKMAEGISNNFIDGIYNKLMDNGVDALKISGAGGGGFMIIWVNPKKRMDVIRSLENSDGFFIPFRFVEDGSRAWRVK